MSNTVNNSNVETFDTVCEALDAIDAHRKAKQSANLNVRITASTTNKYGHLENVSLAYDVTRTGRTIAPTLAVIDTRMVSVQIGGN